MRTDSPSLTILALDVVTDIWWRGRGQVTRVASPGQELARLLGRPEASDKFLPFLPPVRLFRRGPGLNWSQNKGKVEWKSLKYSLSLPCFYCYCCCFFLDIALPLCPLPGLWWHQTVSSSLTLSFYKYQHGSGFFPPQSFYCNFYIEQVLLLEQTLLGFFSLWLLMDWYFSSGSEQILGGILRQSFVSLTMISEAAAEVGQSN